MSKLSARLAINLILWSLSFIFPFSIFAASINISEAQPININDPSQEYQAKINLSIDASDGTAYYLRGVFYQSGSSNYCGSTWNGSSWFSGPYSSNEGWKNFLAVSVSSSSAETLLKAKLDSSDSGCRNNGSYNFKVQRFTAGGSGNFDTQNEQTLTVNIPSLTPTPTDVPTSIPISSPTNAVIPSATPKPQNTVTAYFSPPAVKTTATKVPSATQGLVLGEVSEQSVTPTAEKKPEISADKNQFPVFPVLFGGGILFITAAIALSVKQIRNRRYL